MDVEFWDPRVHSAKTAVHAASLSSDSFLCLDDSEGDDDMRSCFQCPFCCLDIEVSALCEHLQEEHCFDVKNAVCPVCAANLGRDMIGHLITQHSLLFKRRRRSQRTSGWTANNSVIGKDLRDLSPFDGAISTNGRGNTADTSPDPLLAPFLCGLPSPYVKSEQGASSVVDRITSVPPNARSSGPSVSGEVREQVDEAAWQRAEFVQNLLLSTIL